MSGAEFYNELNEDHFGNPKSDLNELVVRQLVE